MISIYYKACVVSCAVFLGLGVTTAARAENIPTTAADRTESMSSDQATRGKTIKGEVVRVEGDNWFIKDERGKEVRLHVDKTTRRSPQKGDDAHMKGAVVEAMINDSNHALSISSPDRRDDRHDHSTTNAGEK